MSPGGNRRAALVLLSAGESFENPLSRFENANAVSYGLAAARREHVDWLIVLGGPVVRLYPADPDVGTGRKGETQTFIELDLSMLSEAECGYLALIFAPEALAAGGAVYRLLGDSARYAAELQHSVQELALVSEPLTLLYGRNCMLGSASRPSGCRVERAKRDLGPDPITLLTGRADSGLRQ